MGNNKEKQNKMEEQKFGETDLPASCGTKNVAKKKNVRLNLPLNSCFSTGVIFAHHSQGELI